MLYILMYTSQMASWMLVMCVCTHNGARQFKRVGAYEQEPPPPKMCTSIKSFVKDTYR